MLNNVKDFGATGDGISDDRVAIQDAIKDAVTKNAGGIFFPSGTYRVSRHPDKRTSIDLDTVKDFMVMGEGPKSVVKLLDIAELPPANPRGDWHVFLLSDCERVVFKDLLIDGNRFGLTTFKNEQYQGIEVSEGTIDLVIDGCIFSECFGDGVRLVGDPENIVTRLRIENCLFQRNKRSGISVQRATEQIIITNCLFDDTESDSSIDIESTATGSPTDVIIQGCIINHTNKARAVSLYPKRDLARLVRCKFSNNIVVGGPIFCGKLTQLTIQNNIVVMPDRGVIRIPISVESGDSVIISGNLVTDESGGEAVIRLSEASSHAVTYALVANNICFARAKNGIYCEGSDDVAIQGNMIVATDSCDHGIFLRAMQSPIENISIRDNDITVKGETGKWEEGVRIAPRLPHHIGSVSVVGNSIRGADAGVVFENKPFTQTPVCALNRIADDVVKPLVGLEFLPQKCIVVGGATSRGGAGLGSGRFIVGLGNPNKKSGGVRGNIGDIFQRLDGGPGETFYVKETANNRSFGWIAK